MSFAERFEDLEIWKESRSLHQAVCKAIENCRDWDFRSQMRRAALSVMNNISEGFERHTDKDFAHLLDQAKGSCGEIRSMTYAAEDLTIFDPLTASKLREHSLILSRRIAAFTRHLRTSGKV